MPFEAILGVSLSVGLALAVGWYVIHLLRKLRAGGRARIEAEVLRGRAPRFIDESANFFGLQSIGAVQLRGNGCLVLAQDELAFAQWVTNRMFRIPLASIIEVDQAKGHLGKWIGRPLLRVRWREGDREETAAWSVRDLAGWLIQLSAARGGAHGGIDPPASTFPSRDP